MPELKCSFCCSVRLPGQDWTPPEALNGPHPETVDFTLCPECEAKITEAEAKIADGSFSPFTGPITKADGSEGVAAGVVLAEAVLLQGCACRAGKSAALHSAACCCPSPT